MRVNNKKNDNNLLKVVNPKLAKKLADLGFVYMLEKYNNQDVYVFQANTDLVKFLNYSNCSNSDFYCSKKLTF